MLPLQNIKNYLAKTGSCYSQLNYISSVALYLYEIIADASEAIGNAGLLLAQPVIIRDTNIVHAFEESVLLCKYQLIKAFRSRFFHTF